MPFTRLGRRSTGAAALATISALALAACSSGDSDSDASASDAGGDTMEPVELSWLLDDTEATRERAQALAAAYTEANPNVTFAFDSRPGGTEGDNIIKTRLQTGDMNDLFWYNSGSLFQALAPSQTLLPIDDIANAGAIQDTYKEGVTADGVLYGVPVEAAMGGGVLYHIPTYERLGLEIPVTWDEFIANSEAIKEDGEVAPIIQTYGDTWTSQLFVLGDNYNVLADNPDFADQYTANEAHYADTPEALAGFEHLQEVNEKDLLNEDYATATYADGLRMVSTGEGAQYPMLTFAVTEIQNTYPDNVADVGFFAIPGDDPDDAGLTTWLGAGVYSPNTTENADAVKDFMNWIATPEACDVLTSAGGATGPYFIDGCELPADVPQATADMLPYFEAGLTAPALEFLSPVKGPNLENITVEVGSGIRGAEDAAAFYDEDVKKQAQQLGLEGW